MNILAADNDIIFLKSLADGLIYSGNNIIIAPNYTDAMYYFEASNPEIVLVDYLLKGDSRTGIDLALEMKFLKPSIRFILLSGLLIREEYDKKGLFLKVFKKPIPSEKIVDYILSLRS